MSEDPRQFWGYGTIIHDFLSRSIMAVGDKWILARTKRSKESLNELFQTTRPPQWRLPDGLRLDWECRGSETSGWHDKKRHGVSTAKNETTDTFFLEAKVTSRLLRVCILPLALGSRVRTSLQVLLEQRGVEDGWGKLWVSSCWG